MLKHHPSPELLSAFSAGSLSMSHALCVSTHVDYCQQCRNAMKGLNQLGASLFEAQAPATVPAELKARLFEQLDAPRAPREYQPKATPSSTCNTDVPRSLRQFVNTDYDALSWTNMGSAVKTTALCRDGAKTQVSMIKLNPGASVGHHGHMGEEITVVLSGSFSDEDGIYQRGDFMVRDGRDKHKPVASTDAPCICLTVQDAPIQFTGLVSRLLNPFLRRRFSVTA